MKCAILLLYSLGYALLMGVMINQSEVVGGASRDLVALTESGARLSGVGYAALQQANETSWVNVVATVALVSLWFGTVFFLFFWKRPAQTGAGAPAGD
jgi:hypothetical protein